MAILDTFALFSGSYANGALTGQTVTGTGVTVNGTNVYDTQAGLDQAVDLGMGEEMDLEVDVMTAFSGGTSVEIQAVTADDSALSANVQVLGSSGPIPIANLTAGARYAVGVPKSSPHVIRRYFGVRYVLVGAVAAGAVAAFFTKDAGDFPQPAYKSGYVIE